MNFTGLLEEGFFNMVSYQLETNGLRVHRSSLLEIGNFKKTTSRLEGLGYRILVRAN